MTIQPATRSLTRDELIAARAIPQHGIQCQSRNYHLGVAALRNMHVPSIAAAIVEAVGTVAARQIARDLDRVAGGATMIRCILFTALVVAFGWHMSDAADRARHDIHIVHQIEGVTP